MANELGLSVLLIIQPRKDILQPVEQKEVGIEVLEGASSTGQALDGGWVVYESKGQKGCQKECKKKGCVTKGRCEVVERKKGDLWLKPFKVNFKIQSVKFKR